MDLRIDKPEWCNDCVFGEESGYCCSLLNGELCYKHGNYEKHRPDWCPFDNDGKTITADGITLLKEQEAKMQGADSGMCEICSFYERAMSVKPHYNARTNWYECGACHYSMTSGMHCRSELIPATKVRYCANCGFPVNWEGR